MLQTQLQFLAFLFLVGQVHGAYQGGLDQIINQGDAISDKWIWVSSEALCDKELRSLGPSAKPNISYFPPFSCWLLFSRTHPQLEGSFGNFDVHLFPLVPRKQLCSFIQPLPQHCALCVQCDLSKMSSDQVVILCPELCFHSFNVTKAGKLKIPNTLGRELLTSENKGKTVTVCFPLLSCRPSPSRLACSSVLGAETKTWLASEPPHTAGSPGRDSPQRSSLGFDPWQGYQTKEAPWRCWNSNCSTSLRLHVSPGTHYYQV